MFLVGIYGVQCHLKGTLGILKLNYESALEKWIKGYVGCGEGGKFIEMQIFRVVLLVMINCLKTRFIKTKPEGTCSDQQYTMFVLIFR
jgi:hypothetical protein